jgi:hypothetical protein
MGPHHLRARACIATSFTCKHPPRARPLAPARDTRCGTHAHTHTIHAFTVIHVRRGQMCLTLAYSPCRAHGVRPAAHTACGCPQVQAVGYELYCGHNRCGSIWRGRGGQGDSMGPFSQRVGSSRISSFSLVCLYTHSHTHSHTHTHTTQHTHTHMTHTHTHTVSISCVWMATMHLPLHLTKLKHRR